MTPTHCSSTHKSSGGSLDGTVVEKDNVAGVQIEGLVPRDGGEVAAPQLDPELTPVFADVSDAREVALSTNVDFVDFIEPGVVAHVDLATPVCRTGAEMTNV